MIHITARSKEVEKYVIQLRFHNCWTNTYYLVKGLMQQILKKQINPNFPNNEQTLHQVKGKAL